MLQPQPLAAFNPEKLDIIMPINNGSISAGANATCASLHQKRAGPESNPDDSDAAVLDLPPRSAALNRDTLQFAYALGSLVPTVPFCSLRCSTPSAFASWFDISYLPKLSIHSFKS